jgi:hypothetical protein
MDPAQAGFEGMARKHISQYRCIDIKMSSIPSRKISGTQEYWKQGSEPDFPEFQIRFSAFAWWAWRSSGASGRTIYAQRNNLHRLPGRPHVASFVFFFMSGAAGKAVRSGHSCAAVTHQSKPPACGERTESQSGSHPVKAEQRLPAVLPAEM